jgi:PAS domain-containing protein
MRVVCSYCRKTIRDDPCARATDVSHGMCEPCATHFGRLWAGMALEEYLDELGPPVLLTDGDARVIAMSRRLADLMGVERASSLGLTAGEAFACAHSRLPEGCGRTVHCRECAVRRLVETVSRTGRARTGVAAYVDTPAGRIDLRVGARAVGSGMVQVTIEEVTGPGRRASAEA